MNFLQRTPFIRLLLPLITGIVCFQYVELFDNTVWLLSFLSLLLLVTPFFFKKSAVAYKFRWFFGLGISLLMFSLGYIVSNFNVQKNHFDYLQKNGLYHVELIEAPVEKDKTILCRIELLSFVDSLQNEQPAKGRALIYLQKDSLAAQLKFGDRILLNTEFNQPDPKLNPEGFDYRTYLSRQGIAATSYVSASNWLKIGRNTEFSLYRLADECQKKLLATYHRFGIQGDEFAVLAALTLGSKDALHPELRQNYTTSGGMHILAVSGLHVGIIYFVLCFIIDLFVRKQSLSYLKAVIVVSLLWLYAFVTGLPPSVVRATIMFTLVAIGASLDRKSQIYNTISVSAYFMLLYNPNFLFDVGFQLSYAAVLSIVYFQPKISKWVIVKNKILKWAWELTSVSLAAQIGTAGFSLYYFNQFPNYFLITNFVAIPFATLIIYFAVLLFAVSSVPYLSVFVAFLLNYLLKILNYSIQAIHDIPYSLTVMSIDFWQLLFVFVSITCFSIYFYNKKFRALFPALFSVLIVVGISLAANLQTLKSDKLIVFADNKFLHLDFIAQKDHFLFTTDSGSVARVAKSYWLANKLNDPIELSTQTCYNDGFVTFKGKRFLILMDDEFKNKTAAIPFELDYLIIGNKIKPRINEILTLVKPHKIIVDKSISKWYTQNIREACLAHNIDFYSIAENGAYVLNFID